MLAGASFLIPAPKPGGPTPHLWIILTDPAPDCIMVNLTTLRADRDQTVVLHPGEHPFVKHSTAVFYADSQIVTLDHVNSLLARGQALPHQPCPPATLQLIQQGILASPFTPRKVQAFYRQYQQIRRRSAT